MKKHKAKIIIAIVAVIALTGAWFLGGAPDVYIPDAPLLEADSIDADPLETSHSYDYADTNDTSEPPAPSPSPEATLALGDGVNPPDYTPSPSYDVLDDDYVSPEPDTNDAIPEYLPTPPPSTPTPQQNETTPSPNPSEPEPTATPTPTPEPEPDIPDDPADTHDESFTVTLTILTTELTHNMHLLDRDKHELVPADGIILATITVTAYYGESVFNILQRETRRAGIHMISRFTPVFNSAYIEAINNLAEFDAGPLSGWRYSVNGAFPNFGSSRYVLSPGDDIVWHFTLDGVGQLDE